MFSSKCKYYNWDELKMIKAIYQFLKWISFHLHRSQIELFKFEITLIFHSKYLFGLHWIQWAKKPVWSTGRVHRRWGCSTPWRVLREMRPTQKEKVSSCRMWTIWWLGEKQSSLNGTWNLVKAMIFQHSLHRKSCISSSKIYIGCNNPLFTSEPWQCLDPSITCTNFTKV